MPQVKPQGRFSALSVPTSPLVFKGGGVHYQPTKKGSVLTTAIGVVTEAIPQMFPEQTQAVGDWIWDNTLGWVLNETFGTNTKISDARRFLEQQEQYKGQVAAQDSKNERIYQQRLEEAVARIREAEAPDAPTLPPSPSETLVDASQSVTKTHSQSSSEDSRNREYLIRRAALGDNPTQEEIRAVVEYELQQHRINFSHLY